jgi:hypothetical protein
MQDDLLDPDRFVQLIVDHVRAPAIEGSVEIFRDPPGRRPAAELVELSRWFTGLTSDDQAFLVRAMTTAVDNALFGVMAMLDGVRSINPRQGTNQRLVLHAELEDGRSRQLNIEGEDDELHDLYNWHAANRGIPTAEH